MDYKIFNLVRQVRNIKIVIWMVGSNGYDWLLALVLARIKTYAVHSKQHKRMRCLNFWLGCTEEQCLVNLCLVAYDVLHVVISMHACSSRRPNVLGEARR